MPVLRVVERVDIGDRNTRRYVPFDIGAGDEGPIRIVLDHDASEATVDLGLWDPDGWRGYSGGARREIVVGQGASTPGYRCGRLPCGRWRVELGIYRASSRGTDVTIVVETNSDAPLPDPNPRCSGALPQALAAMPSLPRGSELNLPAAPGMTWFAGDFHAHTVHSDGKLTIDELAGLAARCGLDFLAVTDHNTVSHHPYLQRISERRRIALIPGQEVTGERGHANVYGDVGWIDFHQPVEAWLRAACERGALMSVNHPLADNCAWQWQMDRLPPLVEFWHSTWFEDQGRAALMDTGIWALWARWDQDAVPIGGSDFHNPAQGWMPGTPTTWVQARDCSVPSILAAVAAGRTAMSWGRTREGASPDYEAVLLPVDGTLHAMHCGGNLLVSQYGDMLRLADEECESVVDHPAHGMWRVETQGGQVLCAAKV